MKIVVLEVYENSLKKMGRFSAACKSGKLIKYSCIFGEGYAHFLGISDNVTVGKEIKVETMYESVNGFKVVNLKKDSFDTVEINEECYIVGKVDFVYKNFDKKELLRITCGEWEFFLGEKEVELQNVENGMTVEFILKGLELYEIL